MPSMPPAPAPDTAQAQIYTAQIAGTGQRFSAPASLPVLVAAERAGLEGMLMDSSCRNGTCRTCICRLTSGEVHYRIEWPGLSPDEKREGYFLPCVAYPASDLVIELPV